MNTGAEGESLYVLILKNTIQFKWFVNVSRWFLLQPITLALVYVGTTLKDLSDVTHGWSEFSKTRWVRASSSFSLFRHVKCFLVSQIIHQITWLLN
jgi:hypothetical protein